MTQIYPPFHGALDIPSGRFKDYGPEQSFAEQIKMNDGARSYAAVPEAFQGLPRALTMNRRSPSSSIGAVCGAPTTIWKRNINRPEPLLGLMIDALPDHQEYSSEILRGPRSDNQVRVMFNVAAATMCHQTHPFR